MTCNTYHCMRLNIFPYINLGVIIRFHCRMEELSRSRWPCGLRSESAAARLLGLRVRIPPGPYISVSWSVVCCQEEVTASGRSLVQRSRTECDREASIMRSPWPPMGCFAMETENGRNNRNNLNIKHESAFPIRAIHKHC